MTLSCNLWLNRESLPKFQVTQIGDVLVRNVVNHDAMNKRGTLVIINYLYLLTYTVVCAVASVLV